MIPNSHSTSSLLDTAKQPLEALGAAEEREAVGAEQQHPQGEAQERQSQSLSTSSRRTTSRFAIPIGRSSP